jgi:hypothetical protein
MDQKIKILKVCFIRISLQTYPVPKIFHYWFLGLATVVLQMRSHRTERNLSAPVIGDDIGIRYR